MTNKSISQYSPAELRKLADQMEEEDRPIKTATLKHDLYDIESQYSGSNRAFYIEAVDWYFDEKFKNKLLEDFKNSINIVLKKGTQFNCYLIAGREAWYDENSEIENMDSAWAGRHLENIRQLRLYDIPEKS